MNVAIGALLCYIILLTERCVRAVFSFFFCLSLDCVVTTTVTKNKSENESETYTPTAAVWITKQKKNLCFILKW